MQTCLTRALLRLLSKLLLFSIGRSLSAPYPQRRELHGLSRAVAREVHVEFEDLLPGRAKPLGTSWFAEKILN
jgi:hypothetical protein